MSRFLICSLIVLGGACERRAVPAKPQPSAPAATVVAAAPPSTSAPGAPSAVPPAPAPVRLEARVHLPPQLAAGQKAPLLLVLHSLGTSAEDIEQRTDWPRFAESHGIAWMAPNGPVDALGRRFWDAGSSCCNFAGPPLDHVSALRHLLEEALAQQPIDPERVFVGGISNGGFMAHRFACDAPELVRGVVSISGAGPLDTMTCKQPTRLRVLEIHGESDPIVGYAGGHLFRNAALPEHASAAKTVTDWATRLGCTKDPEPAGSLDLEKRYAGAETRVSRFPGCSRGEVQLWTVGGGDHYLAFYDPAPELVWRFLQGE
jgi:polyhydroxybutyrate depolymerase